MKDCKFKIGDIVRYGDGSTALAEISKIGPYRSNDKYGYRMYGRQFYGSVIGMYEGDCVLADDKESKKYKIAKESKQ